MNLKIDQELLELMGTKWTPKVMGYNIHWKVTDICVSLYGKKLVQIEKYQGGRNSPSIITTKRLKKFFKRIEQNSKKKSLDKVQFKANV